MRQEPLGLFHRSRRRAGRIGLECLPRLARPPAQLAASMMPPGPERQKRRRAWRVCGGCCCAAMAVASLGCACGKAECLSAPYLSPWGTKQAGCGSTDFRYGPLCRTPRRKVSRSWQGPCWPWNLWREKLRREKRVSRSRWLMCDLCFSSTKSSESLRTIESTRLSWS